MTLAVFTLDDRIGFTICFFWGVVILFVLYCTYQVWKIKRGEKP